MNDNIIESRKERFENIFKKQDLVHPLIASIQLEEKQFNILKNSSINYLAKILDIEDNLTEEKILEQYIKKGSELKNTTPTGMILPKKRTSLEYNILLRDYYQIINGMYFSNELSYCHTPAHLRVKWPNPRREDLSRPRHAPEEVHFDSWSGYSSHGLTFLIGVLGDVKNNRVNFLSPNKKFKEEWLSQANKPSSEDLMDGYEVINFIPEKKSLVILDTAVLHHTFRESDAGIRFSIDNIFLAKQKIISPENIEEFRRAELMDPKLLCNLGSECMYYCNHDDEERKDSKQGSIDPTSFVFHKL